MPIWVVAVRTWVQESSGEEMKTKGPEDHSSEGMSVPYYLVLAVPRYSSGTCQQEAQEGRCLGAHMKVDWVVVGALSFRT